MDKSNLKIEELRLLFERENTRKQSLENKASYFLGIVSIIVTISSTYLNSNIDFNSNLGIILLIILALSFIICIGQCISIFKPTNYHHPIELKDFNKFENYFKIDDETFEKELVDQYLPSIFTNHAINDKIVLKLRISIYSFICFIITLIISVAIL